MVFCQKNLDSSLSEWVKYLWVLFMSEGKMLCWIRLAGRLVWTVQDCVGVEGAEPRAEDLDLLFNLHCNFQSLS